MKEGNLHTVVKTPSLLRVALFRFDSTKHNDIVDAKIGLREMKIQCPEKITVGHLNSLRNKSDALSFIIDTNIDILLISETKLDDSFSSV